MQGYVVYYTNGRSGTHYDCWRRAELPRSQCDYRLGALEFDTFYRMCVRAVYTDGSYSPLSRAVVVRTDTLGFRPCREYPLHGRQPITPWQWWGTASRSRSCRA